MNVVNMIGRIGKDVELSQANGKDISKFSIAITESFKGLNGEWKDRTDWFNIEFWGSLHYLGKGDLVVVQGRIKIDEYQGKYYTKVVAFKVSRLIKNNNEQ